MTRERWTDAEMALLRTCFANTRTADLALTLDRSYNTVANKAAKLGLRKSAAYLASPDAHRLDGLKGMSTRIQPGATPWNKGLPGSTGMQPGCRATQFKNGRPAHAARNYLPIGSLRINADGCLERKLTDDPALAPVRRWTAVHRIVWEATHGPIRAGHIVVFRPGMKSTEVDKITVQALELVTRVENMRRNSLHSSYPPELAYMVQLRGALNRQINRKAKEAKSP